MNQDIGRQSGTRTGMTADVEALTRQIAQYEKQKSALKASIFGLAAAVIVVVLFFYWYFVWSYAVIENVSVTQESRPGSVRIQCDVSSSGYLRYGRGTSTMIEPVKAGEKRNFTYSLPVAPGETSFTVSVRSRYFVFPSTYRRTFATSG